MICKRGFPSLCLLFIATIIILEEETATAQASSDPALRNNKEDCICTFQYAPVCGSDGNTYGNSCQLGCAQQGNTGLTQQCVGECPCSSVGPGWGKEPLTF